jgi:hypothetical protein
MRCAPVLAVGVLLAGGCGAPRGGDPGDHRLHELSNDRVFAALPASGNSPALTQTRARYVHPAFSGGGWDGPSVVVTFGGAGPPRAVFRFFARRAAVAGWRATAQGALHVTDAWAKTYPDGASATLLLTALPISDTASEHRYTLVGAISLPGS